VYFVLIPLLVLGLVLYLFIDRVVETGLETVSENAVGAKVEIDHLRLSLFPLGMQWARLQVANPEDPWRNAFETGKVKFAMDFGQLLRGKYIVQTMEVNDLIFGTRRTTDGSIPKRQTSIARGDSSGSTFSAMARGALETTVEKTPLTTVATLKSGLNVDSLLNILDIRTLKHIDSLKAQALSASQQWNSLSSDYEQSRKKLTEIEAGIKGINTAQLNNAQSIMSAISTVDNSLKQVNEISNAFNTRKASIESDVHSLVSSVGLIDDIVAADFNHLKSLAKLPNLNTTGIARLLVGDEMVKKATTYLHWVDVARNTMQSTQSKPDFESPPRMKGQNIRFPVERAYPKLWIQKALISGGTDSAGTGEEIQARGEVRNISDDQSVTGLPLTVSLEGVEGGGREFTLNAKIDRTKKVPYDEYAATLGGVPLAEFSVGRTDFLNAKLTNARMSSSVSIMVPGNSFDATTKLRISRFSVDFVGEPANVLERIVREVLQGINDFGVSFRLWNTGDKFEVALETDLDDKISQRASSVIGAELANAENQLKKKFDEKIAEKRTEVTRLVAEKQATIENQLKQYQSLVSEKLGLVDAKKKELTDRLEQEKKGKVNDLLKGILKK
jgi:uncharacterized protein (TIGR03545 family)